MNGVETDSYLAIMRHGEAENNSQHVYSTKTKEEGGVDHPLTEKGKKQVALTARELLEKGFNCETVGIVLVSPLQRTLQTAQILVDWGVCTEKVFRLENRLREPIAKEWEGEHTPPKEEGKEEGEARWTHIVEASSLHGESVEAIKERVEKVVVELSQQNLSGKNVILVSHGYPLQVFLKLCGDKNPTVETGQARILPLPLVKV